MATKQVKEVPAPQSNLPAAFSNDIPEWAQNGSGRGSENVGTKDIVLPRLEIIQAQSPIKDEKPDEAVEGHMFNTVTTEILGDMVFIVPVFYRMEYLVWKDQDSGGGFFGAYDYEDKAHARRDQLIKDGENPELIEVVDTPVHYCLRVDPVTLKTEQIVISMSKSKAKVSRKWNATIQLAGGDRFSRAYKVTTFKDKNKQNKTFFNYVVQPAGFPPESVFREAEALYEMFKAGDVRANHEAFHDPAEGGEEKMSTDDIGG